MIRSGALILASCIALLFVPAGGVLFLMVLATFGEPLAPFVIGLWADVLYYPGFGHLSPFYTLTGLVLTCAAFAVHAHLKPGII